MPPFVVLKESGGARRGRLTLAHGTVETPVFMPVGTYGAVKTLEPREVAEAGSQIILGNTYHLYLRPGLEILSKFGGLHNFMGWQKPILTDSGGFQVFSLAKSAKINDEGVEFRSHLNGDRVFLTPELSAQIQQTIGSDIAMVLDECVALPSPENVIQAAVRRSREWAERFLAVPRQNGQLIFGINQGGTSLPLRDESLKLTTELPIDGIAVGGLSVGETHREMVDVLEFLQPRLPRELPHYVMGIGTPLDLLEAVRNGIDMFDCVLPTRNARNGGLFTSEGLLNIRNADHRLDSAPVEEGCDCPCCLNYSRGYLRHLFQIKEILGCRLATLHNLHYYHRFVAGMRQAIETDSFVKYYQEMRPRLAAAYPERTEKLDEVECD